MELIERLRGAAGSDVDLTVSRDSAEEPLNFNLIRADIEIASVRSRLLEPGYGYIRISQFQNTTSADLFDAVQQLASEGPLQGLVVDLRNNPGGTLQSSVEVADHFIEQGTREECLAACGLDSSGIMAAIKNFMDQHACGSSKNTLAF